MAKFLALFADFADQYRREVSGMSEDDCDPLESLSIEDDVVIVGILVNPLRVFSHIFLRHRLFPVTILADSYVLVHGLATSPSDKTVTSILRLPVWPNSEQIGGGNAMVIDLGKERILRTVFRRPKLSTIWAPDRSIVPDALSSATLTASATGIACHTRWGRDHSCRPSGSAPFPENTDTGWSGENDAE